MQNIGQTVLIQNSDETAKEYGEKEKLQAAYALNLCMVSVSQIVDYSDVYILEQEYEGILNNLNLEHMPKDEALLDILRQLLDTITFFRIQEGDKAFIEKEYQQKLKNAMLQGISQAGMALAGIATLASNPVGGALAIASSVGSAYMNYRKNKEDYANEKERQLWQLQKSAIEQFNGLRRELFTTAWRLAAKYKFPDEYRLTERQISQYNEILLDRDAIRRYERLEAVKNNFEAYPPFWYYFGNTANEISRIKVLDEITINHYIDCASKHYEKFLKFDESNLLRQDEMVAFCALEYMDILDFEKDSLKIADLLDMARKHAGSANDILQLCAIAYIKVGKKEDAADVLRYLVNEDYNRILNAQMLSVLYADFFKAENRQVEIRWKYNTLETRVNENYLYLLPDGNDNKTDSEAEFLDRQKQILKKKYTLAFRRFVKKYRLMYNQVLPTPDERKNYPESYFEDKQEAREIREREIKAIFDKGGKIREEYLLRLVEADVEISYLRILNQMFKAVREVNMVYGDSEKELELSISNKLLEKSSEFNKLRQKLESGTFGFTDYQWLHNIKFRNLTGEFFDILSELFRGCIDRMKDMLEIAEAENNLTDFCLSEGIDIPEQLYDNKDEMQREDDGEMEIFSADLLGEGVQKRACEREQKEAMIQIINESLQDIIHNHSKIDGYVEDEAIAKYFSKHSIEKNANFKYVKEKTLVIIDDKGWGNFDLVLTVRGIVPIIKDRIKACVGYDKVVWDNEKLRIGEFLYDNQNIDMKYLLKLFTKLEKYQIPEEEEISI